VDASFIGVSATVLLIKSWVLVCLTICEILSRKSNTLSGQPTWYVLQEETVASLPLPMLPDGRISFSDESVGFRLPSELPY
jgi:hypothetical protein